MGANYNFRLLKLQDKQALHEVFLEAFADYLVPIQLNEEQFEAKLKRESIELVYSGGAFQDDKLVGFILTGLGEWAGKYTAYNAGTGVVPQHRGHALTKQLYEFMLPELRKIGVQQCLLEVINQNKPALKVYQGIGFRITRTLDCFRSYHAELKLSVPAPEGITIVEATKPDWQLYQTFWDVEPTWQNAVEAVERSIDRKILLEARDDSGEVKAYIIFYPKNGAILQLAVSKSARCTGIATALLRQVVLLTEVPALMLINIDTAGPDFIDYLQNRGLKKLLVQHEMLLPIAYEV